MGREVLISDEEARAAEADLDQEHDESSEPGWMTRARGFGRFRRQDSTMSVITPFEMPQQSDTGSNGRPKLTITTSHSPPPGSRTLPQIDTSQTPNYPGSAWSVSPNPETPAARRLPWIHNMNPTSRQQTPPARLAPRASLPPFKAFERPFPESVTPPMPISPVFITPRAGLAQAPNHTRTYSTQPSPANTMTPVTFLLESHQNAPEQAPPVPPIPQTPTVMHNPFATPFDDPETPRTPKAL